MARIHVGTSGFVYRHWRGVLYPRELPASEWLGWYSRVFSTVELNAPFYRLPTQQACRRWHDEVPGPFLFAVKGSRFLTHMKRLTDVDVGLTRYFTPVQLLGEKLGPVLWQLPPQMKKPDPERLHRFLSHLPRHVRSAVEFRHPDWYCDEVCAVLDAHGAAFCEHDLVARKPPRHTGGFRYIRFHGAGAKYAGRYGRRVLRPWARELLDWTEGGRHAFVYFNNDLGGHAVRDALDMLELLDLARPEALASLPEGAMTQ